MRCKLLVPMTFLACAAQADEPSLKIAGVTITRGMKEANVRAAFPVVKCIESGPNSCLTLGVGDGVPPEYDGEVRFQDGQVRSAVRRLPLPEEPGEVLMLLYTALERVANADRTCAQVQLFSNNSGLKSMSISWPDRALWIQTHGPTENQRMDMIKETLVPVEQKGDVTWKGRCVYGD
jgi:hypothetical protein